MNHAISENIETIRTLKLKIGCKVRVLEIPDDLTDACEIGTPRVFRESLGKVFRIQGFDDYGYVEVRVSNSDVIWIEPHFLVRVKEKRKTQTKNRK